MRDPCSKDGPSNKPSGHAGISKEVDKQYKKQKMTPLKPPMIPAKMLLTFALQEENDAML